MYLGKNKYSPNSDREYLPESVEMEFVGKILRLTLENGADEISIVSREFTYGAGGTVKPTRLMKVKISKGEVVSVGDKIDINLSGVVINADGHDEKFAFCFSLWRDSFVGQLLKSDVNKTIDAHSFEMKCEHLPSYLSDSVFGLDLYLRGISGRQIALGQGRGYLVFGEIFC